MKSSAQLNLEPFNSERPAEARSGTLDAALARQRRQQEVRRLQDEHAGALDIERLIARLPGGGSDAGLTLRRNLRQHGRYVRLSRPLGHAALTWASQLDESRPGAGRASVWQGWPTTRLAPVLNGRVAGLLERLAGVRVPGNTGGEALTLEPGRAALLLPASSGALLLAEHEGQVFQFLPSGVDAGRWTLLEDASAFRTGQEAMLDEGSLGLERQPLAWTQLSSARRRERARRVRTLVVSLVLVLTVLLLRVLTHGGLWLLIGPAMLLLLFAAWSLERRFTVWVQQGSAQRHLPDDRSDFPVLGAQVATVSAEHERLLSAQTQGRLETLRRALTRAAAVGGSHLTAAVAADLNGLLEDRFSYPAPDAALDTLLEGQIEALQRRLDERLGLERQRARELAAERLRRETIDPHF